MNNILGYDFYLDTEPLASRMRPKDLDEFVGQKELVSEGKILRRMIEEDIRRYS